MQGVQILLFLLFGVLSYFLGFVLLILLFGFFPTFWDFIFILILIFSTSPMYILFSYFLVLSIAFLVADIKSKPNLPQNQLIKYIIKPNKIADEERLASYKNLTVDSVTYQTNRKTNF